MNSCFLLFLEWSFCYILESLSIVGSILLQKSAAEKEHNCIPDEHYVQTLLSVSLDNSSFHPFRFLVPTWPRGSFCNIAVWVEPLEEAPTSFSFKSCLQFSSAVEVTPNWSFYFWSPKAHSSFSLWQKALDNCLPHTFFGILCFLK